jgi:predicted transcriptional regulator YdeE
MEGCHAEISLGFNPIGRNFTFAQPHIVRRSETLVMGIELRGQRELGSDISQLWHRLLTEREPYDSADLSDNLSANLVKVQTVYAVHTDYASDCREHSLVLASRVCSIDNPPEHQVGIVIPAGCYLAFEESDFSAGAALRIWQQVWRYFRTESLYQRAFTTDFEQYEPQQTRVYVAVKSEPSRQNIDRQPIRW